MRLILGMQEIAASRMMEDCLHLFGREGVRSDLRSAPVALAVREER